MTIIKHSNLIRDLALNANDNNINTIMDIITMLDDVNEYDKDKIEFTFKYSDTYVEIDISSILGVNIIFQLLYNDRVFYYYNTALGMKSKEINFLECKKMIRDIVSQSSFFIESKYEVGDINE